MMWEPTRGKWYNDEHYDTKEPLWCELLELASHYGDIKKLQQIISWFHKQNMHGDYYKILLIGCVLKKAGVSLEDYIGARDRSLIDEITAEGNTIGEYAIHLLKKENVDEEFIDEFRRLFA